MDRDRDQTLETKVKNFGLETLTCLVRRSGNDHDVDCPLHVSDKSSVDVGRWHDV